MSPVDRLFTAPMQLDPLGVHRTGTTMSGSNGADLGQVLAMLGDLLVGQRGLERRMDQLESRMDELASQVVIYHGSVVGHGVLISELDTRLRRVEQHLDLPPVTQSA